MLSHKDVDKYHHSINTWLKELYREKNALLIMMSCNALLLATNNKKQNFPIFYEDP